MKEGAREDQETGRSGTNSLGDTIIEMNTSEGGRPSEKGG